MRGSKGQAMEITFQLMDLVKAGIPLIIFIMSILGVLMRYMILNPLNHIAVELQRIERSFNSHDHRITILETKELHSQKQLSKLMETYN